nr:MAG TPA: hypothetical protein [Caudoviricetes sp.]
MTNLPKDDKICGALTAKARLITIITQPPHFVNRQFTQKI